MPPDIHLTAEPAFEVINVFTLADGSGGNPLGLAADADVADGEMQRLAAALGFSETIFLTSCAGEGEPVAAARIFTPGVEVPFAGHPLVGAAWHLGRAGRRSPFVIATTAGPVRCWFDHVNDTASIEAPCTLSTFQAPPTDELAMCLSVEDSTFGGSPVGLSIGLPFVVVELRTREQLRHVRVDVERFRAALEPTGADAVLCWTRASGGTHDIDARMFSPLDGIGEDPATGSACGALAASLAAEVGGPLRIRVRQGEDMGQPCEILAEVDPHGIVRLSGRCVLSRSAVAVPSTR